MSGTKTSRADLKNRFKKRMYPTEEDFANVFESYVHKDDNIPMSQVVLTDGDGNTTTLNNVIGNKADKTDLTEITNRLTTAENDIDTAEDNIAGHETRLQTLETFKERVRAFLEDADASDETINRWHEIESFLQGITDTQTLTGLLNDLKQEILQSIPQSQQGNYLQLIDDLDAYTDAPVGTIVKYTGPTNNKYTHGFDYEKVGGNPITLPAHVQRLHLVNLQLLNGEAEDLNGWYIPTEETIAFCCPGQNTAIRIYGLPLNAASQYVQPGHALETLGEITQTYESGYVSFESGRGLTASEMAKVQDESQWNESRVWQNVQTGQKIIVWSTYYSSVYNLVSTSTGDSILATDGEVITSAYNGIAASGDDQNTIWTDPEESLVIGDAPASWQPSKSMSVID